MLLNNCCGVSFDLEKDAGELDLVLCKSDVTLTRSLSVIVSPC